MNAGGHPRRPALPEQPGGRGRRQRDLGEAFTVQPFGNSLVTMTLTGAQIDALLEQFMGGIGILQVSNGFSYTRSNAAPAGAKVSNITLNGVPIVAGTNYRVTVNSFLADGGDNYTVLRTARTASPATSTRTPSYPGRTRPASRRGRRTGSSWFREQPRRRRPCGASSAPPKARGDVVGRHHATASRRRPFALAPILFGASFGLLASVPDRSGRGRGDVGDDVRRLGAVRRRVDPRLGRRRGRQRSWPPCCSTPATCRSASRSPPIFPARAAVVWSSRN